MPKHAGEISQFVDELMEGVAVDRDALVRLDDAKPNPLRLDAAGLLLDNIRRTAEKDGAGETATGGDLTEAGLAGVDLTRRGPLAIDILIDDAIPGVGEIMRELVADAGVIERQTAREDEGGLITAHPEGVDDGGHQAEDAAGPLELLQRGPIVVEALEDLGVDRVGGLQAVEIGNLRRCPREITRGVVVEAMKLEAGDIASVAIGQLAEQTAADDLEPFLGGDRLSSRNCILPPGAIIIAEPSGCPPAGTSGRASYQQPRQRKLSEDEQRLVRLTANSRSLRDLAAEYGVSHETTRSIRRADTHAYDLAGASLMDSFVESGSKRRVT